MSKGCTVFLLQRYQAASGLNFNPNAFITFKIALKLGLPSFDRVRYRPSRVRPVAAARFQMRIHLRVQTAVDHLLQHPAVKLAHIPRALADGNQLIQAFRRSGVSVMCVVLPVSSLGPDTVHFTDPDC